MHTTLHTFIPGQTIDAIIRLKGRHDLTQEQLIPLRAAFNELNGTPVVKAGMTLLIPLPEDARGTAEAEIVSSENNQSAV